MCLRHYQWLIKQCLQPRYFVGPLRFRPGRPGGAAEWQGNRVGRGRCLPGDPDPVPTSNSPGAWALRAFPCGAQIGGEGGCRASDAPTHPSQRTPLPVHVRQYHAERDPGMLPSEKVAVLGCGRAVFSVSSPRSSSGFTRPSATLGHYETVAPARR